MGTSLSGLTPATTFDGLLKTSDNDALTTTLKTIGSGDGTDSQLKIATNSTQMGNIQFVSGNVITTTSPSSNLRITSGGVGINGDYSNPTANTMLHIKGSGATSATTSLLVQNSNGADVLQTLDNGSVGVGTPANSSYRVTMTAGVLRLKDLLFGQTGSTAINNTSLLTMKWNGSTGIGISDNGAIDATARLHVKGAGNTDATTSLLVQNSDASDLFKITDDRNIETYDATGNVITKNNAGNRRFEINPDLNSLVDFQVSGGGLSNLIRTDSGLNAVGIGANGLASTRFLIKGGGATSATTSLLVQNSDGTDMVKVTDDGVTTIQGNVDALGGDVAIFQNNTDPTNQFKINKKDNSNNIWHTGTTNTEIQYRDNIHFRFNHGGVTQMQLRNTGNLGLGIGGSNASARMHVKGSGATSATTALLVENSSGTDTLEVRDDGRVVAGTGATTNANGTFNVLHGTSNLTTRVFTVSRDSVLRGMDINSGGSTKISDSSGDQSFSHTATAVFEVSSTTQGFLPPRMTGTQRDAIESPASGLIIYNTTTNKAQCYNGTSWNDMF